MSTVYDQLHSTGERWCQTRLSTLTETTISGPAIQSIHAIDACFSLPVGAGSDAMHTSPVYAMSLTCLKTEESPTGVGLALALGINSANRLTQGTTPLQGG